VKLDAAVATEFDDLISKGVNRCNPISAAFSNAVVKPLRQWICQEIF
jgi:hypothetical protein